MFVLFAVHNARFVVYRTVVSVSMPLLRRAARGNRRRQFVASSFRLCGGAGHGVTENHDGAPGGREDDKMEKEKDEKRRN